MNSVNKNLVRDSHGLFPGKGEYLLVLGECSLHSPSLCNRLLRNFFPKKRQWGKERCEPLELGVVQSMKDVTNTITSQSIAPNKQERG